MPRQWRLATLTSRCSDCPRGWDITVCARCLLPLLPLSQSSVFPLMSNTGYVDERTLRPGHSQTVNCLAFSPDGRYLASGGDDAFLIIWTVEDGCLLYRLQFESAIDSVIWHPVHPETVIVGCEDGTIVQLRGFTIVGYTLGVLPTISEHNRRTGMRGMTSSSASEEPCTVSNTMQTSTASLPR